MTAATTNTDQPTIPQPEWTSSALTMRIWFNNLIRWIPRQDKAYRPLIERGYYINRDKAIVSCIPQALDMTEGNIDLHSFHDPAPALYVQNKAAFAAAMKRTNDEAIKRRPTPPAVSAPLLHPRMMETTAAAAGAAGGCDARKSKPLACLLPWRK